MTAILVESALRSLLLAALVGLGLTLFRVRNVPARKIAWTLVLVAAIAMPGLMRVPLPSALRLNAAWAIPTRGAASSAEDLLAPGSPTMSAWVQSTAKSADPEPATSAQTAPSDLHVIAAVDRGFPADPAIVTSARHRFQWPPVGEIVLWAYLIVGGALLLRLLIGLLAAIHLWMTATAVSPLIAPEPNVRASSRIPAPVTVGSGIVLPADYTHWDHSKLRMVIAHERSHVRQMDFYLQLLAGLYTAVFWFSPLGWWLRHVLCSLGEAIGDRAGMEAAKTRSMYAETLLEIAALPHRSLPGVAMARSANLSQRVESMLNDQQLRRAFVEGRHRAAASLLLIPAALFIALAVVRAPAAAAQSTQQASPAPQPDTQQQQQATTGQSTPPEDQVTTTKPSPDEQQSPSAASPSAPASSAIPAAPGTTPTPESQPAAPPAPPAPGADAVPAMPAQPPAPAASPDLPPSPGEDGQSITTFSGRDSLYHFGDKPGSLYDFQMDADPYALVTGPDQSMTFSGSWDGEQRSELEKARRVARVPFLWFRHDGKSYVVTDPAVISALQKTYAPMQELGKQQEALGRQQEALGRRQEELGRQQQEAGTIRMPDLSREMADVNAALDKMRDEQTHWNAEKWSDLEAKLKADQDKMLTPETMAEIQQKLGALQAQWNSERMAEFEARMAELQAKLGTLQGQAGARMGAFGRQMGELGRQQGELGRQQGRLGEQEGRLARELNREVQRVIAESLANGKAKPVQ